MSEKMIAVDRPPRIRLETFSADGVGEHPDDLVVSSRHPGIALAGDFHRSRTACWKDRITLFVSEKDGGCGDGGVNWRQWILDCRKQLQILLATRYLDSTRVSVCFRACGPTSLQFAREVVDERSVRSSREIALKSVGDTLVKCELLEISICKRGLSARFRTDLRIVTPEWRGKFVSVNGSWSWPDVGFLDSCSGRDGYSLFDEALVQIERAMRLYRKPVQRLTVISSDRRKMENLKREITRYLVRYGCPGKFLSEKSKDETTLSFWIFAENYEQFSRAFGPPLSGYLFASEIDCSAIHGDRELIFTKGLSNWFDFCPEFARFRWVTYHYLLRELAFLLLQIVDVPYVVLWILEFDIGFSFTKWSEMLRMKLISGISNSMRKIRDDHSEKKSKLLE
jgi:hypothetical protein